MGVFTNKVLPKKGLEFSKNDEVVELVASSTTFKKRNLRNTQGLLKMFIDYYVTVDNRLIVRLGLED